MNKYIVTAVDRLKQNRTDFEVEASTVFYAICAFENRNPGWIVINVNLKEITKVG